MFWSARFFSSRARALGAILCLALLVTACGGGEDESPTATTEPVAAEATATPEPEPTATSTPEPEPTATATLSLPPPTVAAPLFIPPTAIPTSTPEPTPEPVTPTVVPDPVVDVPTQVPDPSQDPGSEPDPSAEGPQVTDLLLSTDLTDWVEMELENGHTYIHEGGYYVWVPLTEGQGIYVITEQADYSDAIVSLDVQLTTDTPEALGCLVTHTEPTSAAYRYALCINGYGEAYAAFEYVDEAGNFQFDLLVDYVVPETINPTTDVNTLTIYSYGSDRVFFVNDEIVGSAFHTGAAGGAVGAMVINWDFEAAEFRFTNLEAWALE